MASDEAQAAKHADQAAQLEELRSQKERLELKSQIAALSAPWWRRAGLLAGATAILAAVLPLKTAIEESYRNDRELALQQAKEREELALQRAKQEHEIRMAYLDRYEVPGHRLQTLRFLIATTTDSRLLAWAEAEKKLVQVQLDAIEQQLLAVAQKIERAQSDKEREALDKELKELNKLKDMATLRPAPQGAGSAGQ